MANNKVSKSGSIAVIVFSAVLIAILNVCTFAIPFNKVDLAVHFTAYGCAEALILIEMGLSVGVLFLEEDMKARVLGLPIVFSCYIALIAQLILTAVFYVVNAFVALPIWIVVIVECVFFAIVIIQLVKGFFFKAHAKEFEENTADTKFMDEFRVRLKAIRAVNNNENIAKAIEDLVDTALASDPVTNERTVDSEGELLSLLQALDLAIKNGSESEARDILAKCKSTLLERNALCKAGK